MSAEYEVLAVRYGTWETSRADCFHRYQVYGEADGPIRMDYFFWILRNGVETILVDTGFAPTSGVRRGRTVLIDPIDALAELGIAADDVEHVVISHFHYDHIGNLEAFPRARLTVQQRELDFWTGPYARRLQFRSVAEPGEIDYLVTAVSAGRVRCLDGDAEIAPGVTAQLVGGHCPGQQIIVVRGEGPPVVLATDALHFYEEMERDMPFAIFSDLAETYAAYDVLRDLEAQGAVIVAGHDPAVMDRFPGIPGLEAVAVKIGPSVGN